MAYLLLTVAVLGLCVTALFGSALARMYEEEPLTSLARSVVWLLIAVGARLITRRRAAGLLFLLLLPAMILLHGDTAAGLIALILVLVVFAIPFGMVYLQALRWRDAGVNSPIDHG